jgi:hypothetical protein
MLPSNPFDEWWIQRLLSSPQPDLTREELAYWRSRTSDERFQMAELLRQRFYGYDPKTLRMRKDFFEIIPLSER